VLPEIDLPARIPHEITETHRPGIGRIIGAVDNGAGAGHLHRRGRPDDGRRIRIRPADEERRRTGGGRHQRRRRRARQEAGAAGRRRCLRSQAGALGGGKVRQREDPASEAYADGNVLQITPASTNPLFTERKLWNVARVCGRDDQQGLVAAEYIVKNYKGKNVAILNDKTTYGKGLADETKKALNKAGFTEKMFESYNKGDKDFNSIVSRLKRDNIDLVFVGGYHQEAGLILRQMRDQGLKTVLMAGDAMNDKEFASITGPAAEGTLFTFGPDPRNKPTAKAIVEKFKAKNIDPEGYTLYTYAAMQVWTQAVAKAKTTDPKKVMETIKAGDWDTVLGKMGFDAKGDIKVIDYVVYKWDAKGNYTEINPKGS
jgi:branched-chain amino acid transport system substrate-binding protein